MDIEAGFRLCLACGLIFELEQFPIAYIRNDKVVRRHRCPECYNASRRKAYQEDPEARAKRIASVKAWKKLNAEAVRLMKRRADHRRRVSLIHAGDEVSLDEYRSILLEPCVYCGAYADNVDHILPVSKGGSSSRDNLVAACGSCNRSKSNKLLRQWDAVKVARAVAVSPKVRDEYIRQASD